MTTSLRVLPYFQELMTAYHRYGNAAYLIDEAITQSEHALQAAYIADRIGAPSWLIIAMLFHDIGQMTNPSLVGETAVLHYRHDDQGADWLKSHGFPEHVVDCVRYHTLAKLMWCDKEPHYYERLSQASKDSYHIQKAKYAQDAPEAIERFKSSPYANDFLTARLCDELAKFEAVPIADAQSMGIPPFLAYAERTEQVRLGHGLAPSDPQYADNAWYRYEQLHSDPKAFFAWFSAEIPRSVEASL